jgi:tetratricopeptide (TPR) repeat protein
VIELALFLLVGQSTASADQPPAAAQGPIVVSGEREERRDGERIEEPYTETERVPLGSRIPRRRDARAFSTVASESGLAGMISGPGINYDATGGSGGTPLRVRNRVVRECVAGSRQVSERTACILYRVRQAIEAQDHAGAAALLEPLLRSGTLSSIDRYYAASFSYQLAQVTDDDARRESALTAMIESGRIPAADRPNATRMLARLAAQRGDNGAAIARIERLVAEMPDDPRNHADLAWLYARSGRDGEALPRMMTAVQLARRAGSPVPQAWLDFIGADP